jgi:hypothetical protein
MHLEDQEYLSICFSFAGPPTPTNTEFWNGTSWTEVNDLAVAFRTGIGAFGSSLMQQLWQ